MAWDKNRPYAPFWNRTDFLANRYGSMESYDTTWPPFEKKDIDRIWAGEEVTTNSCIYKPFKDVRLKLRLKGFEARRAAGLFWWTDEQGKSYPMFATEFNRLADEGVLDIEMDGVWSAEKRGANYGVSYRGCEDAR